MRTLARRGADAEQLSPELAPFLPQLTGDNPIVMFAYADESTLRSASNSGKFDLGVVLVTAAIAIPNLMRSRTAANEAAAAATMRTVTRPSLRIA